MWQREYITNPDYELAFTMPDHPDTPMYECKHCGCYTTGIIEHLDEEHWWIKDAEVIVVP